MMDVRAARLFVAAAEAGTLTGAAARVAVSQPAASKLLAQTEARLGGALFLRVGRRLSLTPLGDALLPRARALAQTARDIETEARAWKSGESGAVVLGVGPSVAYRLLPDAAARFYGEGGRAALTIRAGPSAALIDALLQGDIDIVAADLGATEGVSGLRITALPEERIGAAVRPDHPALRGAPLSRFPSASATPPGRMQVQPAPFGARAPTLVCDDYSVLGRACAASDHILLASTGVLDRVGAEAGLVRLPLLAPEARVRPGLVERAGAPASAARERLRRAFLAAAAV